MIDDKQRADLISSLETLDEIRDRLIPIGERYAKLRILLFRANMSRSGIDKVNKGFRMVGEVIEIVNRLDAEIIRALAWEEEE
jgi:hypothetical protein